MSRFVSSSHKAQPGIAIEKVLRHFKDSIIYSIVHSTIPGYFPVQQLETSTGPLNITRKCMTLWGEPNRVHTQNMEQLYAFQNVAEPQATENHIKYTHVYTGTLNQA